MERKLGTLSIKENYQFLCDAVEKKLGQPVLYITEIEDLFGTAGVEVRRERLENDLKDNAIPTEKLGINGTSFGLPADAKVYLATTVLEYLGELHRTELISDEAFSTLEMLTKLGG